MTPRILNPVAELVPVGDLLLHPQNPNTGDIPAIVHSIQTLGWFGALVVQKSTGYILKGNHSYQAAVLVGLTAVPVFWVDLSDREALKLLLADNRLGELGVRDAQRLAALLAQLHTEGDLTGSGYGPDDYLNLLDQIGVDAQLQGHTDEEDVPPLPDEKHVISRDHDIWSVGDHRVGCGSSLDPQHVQRLINGLSVRLVWTDPPYNVNYEGKTKDRLKIANDAMTPAQFRDFLGQGMRVTLDVMQPGACIYVAYAELEGVSFRQALDAAGWKYSQTLVWVKNAAVMGRQDYNWRHEPLLYGWKPGAGHYFNLDFTQTTVIDDTRNYRKMSRDDLVAVLEAQRDSHVTTVAYEDKPHRNDLHPTMKPVNLVQRFVIASSRAGDAVYDPFGGSGTTAIAAHKTHRVAVINELEPRYVDVIVERLQAFSGLQATRHDGVAYDDLKLSREGRA